MTIYISNLSSNIKDQDLKNLFTSYGEVESAEITNDVFTGESRGFGYVEMNDEAAAQKAIEGLHNTEVESYTITVEQAKPKEVRKGSYKVGNGTMTIYKFRKK